MNVPAAKRVRPAHYAGSAVAIQDPKGEGGGARSL